MVPLVGTVPLQEGLPLPAEEDHSLLPDSSHVAFVGSQTGTLDAVTGTGEGLSSAAQPSESPVTLQLFIVSQEGADMSPESAIAGSAKRRRSSGIRRTLLAQLQVLARPTP